MLQKNTVSMQNVWSTYVGSKVTKGNDEKVEKKFGFVCLRKV